MKLHTPILLLCLLLSPLTHALETLYKIALDSDTQEYALLCPLGGNVYQVFFSDGSSPVTVTVTVTVQGKQATLGYTNGQPQTFPVTSVYQQLRNVDHHSSQE